MLDVNALNTEVVAIDTADAVTDTNTNVVGGTQEAAEVTVTATAGSAINILIDTVVDGAGYALSGFVCKYDVGVEAACDSNLAIAGGSVVSSGPLLIGASLTADGTAVAGAANGSFVVNVDYQ